MESDNRHAVRSVGDHGPDLSGKVLGCAGFFVWMVITLVFVNLFIGIVTDLYPLKRYNSNKDWEALITRRMAAQLFTQQQQKQVTDTELAMMPKKQQQKKGKNLLKLLKAAKGPNTSIIKLGIMRASAKLHLLRGADGYHFWKKPVGCVMLEC